jgi:hypothetical protein
MGLVKKFRLIAVNPDPNISKRTKFRSWENISHSFRLPINPTAQNAKNSKSAVAAIALESPKFKVQSSLSPSAIREEATTAAAAKTHQNCKASRESFIGAQQ